MEAPVTDDLIDLDTQYIPGVSPYTNIEVNIYAALDTLRVRYIPQKRFGYWTVDAWLPKLRVALEADGCTWHGCWLCQRDMPEVRHHEKQRSDRDERLWYLHHVPTLHIWGHNLQDTETALNAVRAVLEPWMEGGTPH